MFLAPGRSVGLVAAPRGTQATRPRPSTAVLQPTKCVKDLAFPCGYIGMAGVRPTRGRLGARWHRHARAGSIPGSGAGSVRVRPTADDRLLAPLRRHWGWTLLGLLIAAVAAATRFAAIGVLPPSVKTKPFAHADASTSLTLGDAWQQSASNVPSRYDKTYAALSYRAYALADMVNSPEITEYVARAAGLPASKIGIIGPLWTDQWRIQQWPTGPKRASQIVAENDPYQITLNEEAGLPPYQPVIGVYTQAPSTETAARLASAVPEGLSAYLQHIQATTAVPERDRYNISQLGPVSVDPAHRSQLANVGVFTFLGVFVLWCGILIAVSSLVRDLRATAVASKVGGSPGRSSDNGRLVGDPANATS